MGRALRAAGLAAGLSVVVSCAAREYPGDALDALPPDAVATVSLGPQGIETSDLFNENRALTFAFDGEGNVVGRLEGEDIYANQVLASKRNLVTVSARAVTTLTDTSRIEFPIDEHMVEAAANDPESGATTIWFNSGRESTFVSIDADNEARSGAVSGMVQTVAYCGNRHFAIADDLLTPTTDGLNSARLYEVLPSGGPVVRGEWREPIEFSPASRVSACAPDGRTLFALYRSPIAPDGTEPGLTLIAIDVADGSRSETPLDMAGYKQATRRGSTVIGDRLHWVSLDGDALSVSLAGSPTVTREWTIPDAGEESATSVAGTTVTTIDNRTRPVFSQYDLRTGARTRGPVALPWLESVVDSRAESGNTFYAVSDVDGLEP